MGLVLRNRVGIARSKVLPPLSESILYLQLEGDGALFRLSGGEDYVVPFRLPRKAPRKAEMEWGAETKTDELRVHFSFVPPGFVERLIARLQVKQTKALQKVQAFSGLDADTISKIVT